MIESDMVKGIIQYKCDLCGKVYYSGCDADGIPFGTGFHFSDGSELHFCKSCATSRYQDAILKMVDAKKRGQD